MPGGSFEDRTGAVPLVHGSPHHPLLIDPTSAAPEGERAARATRKAAARSARLNAAVAGCGVVDGSAAEGSVAGDSAADAYGRAEPRGASTGAGADDELAHAERVPDADEMEDVDDKVREAQGMLIPTPPSAVELERHSLTHVPYAPWCATCVKSR
eukprot:9711791-Heterocapsa_arctica.AAC.1